MDPNALTSAARPRMQRAEITSDACRLQFYYVGVPCIRQTVFAPTLPNSAVQPEDVLYILEVVLPNWELPHSVTLLRVPVYLGRSNVSTSRPKKLLKTPIVMQHLAVAEMRCPGSATRSNLYPTIDSSSIFPQLSGQDPLP